MKPYEDSFPIIKVGRNNYNFMGRMYKTGVWGNPQLFHIAVMVSGDDSRLKEYKKFYDSRYVFGGTTFVVGILSTGFGALALSTSDESTGLAMLVGGAVFSVIGYFIGDAAPTNFINYYNDKYVFNQN